jgi:hypothetical protein
LCAPVYAGEAVGEIVFSCDGEEIARVPLCAENGAEALPKTKSKMELLKDFFTLNK